MVLVLVMVLVIVLLMVVETVLVMGLVICVLTILYVRLAAEPDAWWLGQFIGYLLRHNDTVSSILEEQESSGGNPSQVHRNC